MNVGIGFYVKGGEIQGRVVDTMISGNVYDDFFRVRGLGKKIEYNPQVYSPDMYFSEIQVSGKG
jgi:PmbA protein